MQNENRDFAANQCVIWGVALSLFNINIWHFGDILPAIGIILSLLGYRALQYENKYFRSCFYISVLRIALMLPQYIMDATILKETMLPSGLSAITMVITLIIRLAEFTCLGYGLKTVQEEAGLLQRKNTAFWLIPWFLIMSVLAYYKYAGIFALCSSCGGLCRGQSLRRQLSDELACSQGFGAGTNKIREQLKEKGVPETILNDLTDDEIAICKEPLRTIIL